MQPIIAAENPEGLTIMGPDPTKPFTSLLYMFSAAFSPNLDNPPFYVDLPFDENVQIVEEVAQRWAAYDLLQILPDYVSALASFRGIYLDAGDKDELGEQLIAQAFSEALSAAGIDHELEIFDGMHMDKMHTRLAVSLSFLSDALGMMQQLTMSQEEANKAIVGRWVELWNTGDLAIADEIFAADFVNHDPGFPDVTDLESCKGYVVLIHTGIGISDIHVTLHDMVAQGDKVACRYTTSYTMPDGKQVTVTAINIDRFADGKIVEQRWSYDMLGSMEQRGVMPPTREDYIWGVPSEVTGDPGTPEANEELVKHIVGEVLNKQNPAAFDEIMATNVVWHDPVTGDIIGIEVLKQLFVMYFTAFPDFHIAIEDIIAEGDKVAGRWTATCTHEGEFMGITPTGVQTTTSGMVIHRFADGKIVESWHLGDNLGMLQQLGAIPPAVKDYSNAFFMALSPGLNMISLPLEHTTPYTARSLAEHLSATLVIKYDETLGRFVGFTLGAPDEYDFAIEGGKGYIVNVPGGGMVAFVGAAWTRRPCQLLLKEAARGHLWSAERCSTATKPVTGVIP